MTEYFVNRVVVEHAELNTRLNALNAFVKTDAFNDMCKADRLLLNKQRGQMAGYLRTLETRIKRFKQRGLV